MTDANLLLKQAEGKAVDPAASSAYTLAQSDAVYWFGLRRSSIVEITIFLGLALMADIALFAGDRFISVSPHPFWVLVILISAQYGTADGLLAAVASSGVLLLGNIPERSLQQDTYQYLLAVLRLPLMWLVSAVVLGELRQRHVRERSELRKELRASLEREEQLAHSYERVSQVKQNLETRIAGQIRTAMTMYDAARALERQDPGEVLLGIGNAVHDSLNPEQFSLFLLKGDTLEISIADGWTEENAKSRFFKPDSLIFREIVGRQRLLCATNPEDERILGPEGVLAGPIVDVEHGQVIGMLKVESLGFLDLHYTNVQTFKVMCQWIAEAYVNAQHQQDAGQETVISRKTELFSHSFFLRQKEYLRRLAERIGFDVSMITMKLDVESTLTDEESSRISGVVQRNTQSLLRKTDMAFDYQLPGLQFCVLLPNTDSDGAAIVARKLQTGLNEELGQNKIGGMFDVEITSLHSKGNGASA